LLKKSYLQTSSKSFKPNPLQNFQCEGGSYQRMGPRLVSPSKIPKSSRSKMTFFIGVAAPPGQVAESSFTRKSWPSARPVRRDTRWSKASIFSLRFKRSRTGHPDQSNRRQPIMLFQKLSSLLRTRTLDQLISRHWIKKPSPWPLTKNNYRESSRPRVSHFTQLSIKASRWPLGSRWLRVCNTKLQACQRTPHWWPKSTDSRKARGVARWVINLLSTFLARVASEILTASVKTRMTLSTLIILCVLEKIKGRTTSSLSRASTIDKTLTVNVRS